MRSRQNTISCVQYSSARYYDTAACDAGLGARRTITGNLSSLFILLLHYTLAFLSSSVLTYTSLLRRRRVSMLCWAFLPFLIFPVLLSKPRSFTAPGSCVRWTYQNNGSVIQEVKLHSLTFSVLVLRYWGEGAAGLDVPR